MIKKKAKTESKRGQKRRGRFLFLGLIRPTINFGWCSLILSYFGPPNQAHSHCLTPPICLVPFSWIEKLAAYVGWHSLWFLWIINDKLFFFSKFTDILIKIWRSNILGYLWLICKLESLFLLSSKFKITQRWLKKNLNNMSNQNFLQTPCPWCWSSLC